MQLCLCIFCSGIAIQYEEKFNGRIFCIVVQLAVHQSPLFLHKNYYLIYNLLSVALASNSCSNSLKWRGSYRAAPTLNRVENYRSQSIIKNHFSSKNNN